MEAFKAPNIHQIVFASCHYFNLTIYLFDVIADIQVLITSDEFCF